MPPAPRLLTRFGNVFFAFDKPAGMAVHPNAEDLPDLVSWMKKQRSLPRDLKPGHRLDRPTSGVVLCGAGKKARAQIGEWLANDSTKTYLALVAGVPPHEEGVFDAPLYDDRRKRPLDAQTNYRIHERLGAVTLLELQLVTGRKHQLRRHLADAGLPVVGDNRYGPQRPLRVPGFPKRLWLHAASLQLGEREIKAALPPELEAHRQQLAADPVHAQSESKTTPAP